VSVGFDEPAFETITWPKLAPVVGDRWRDPLTVVQADVRDFASSVQPLLLFWDAYDVGRHHANRVIPCSSV
jgi:hypothetical protein